MERWVGGERERERESIRRAASRCVCASIEREREYQYVKGGSIERGAIKKEREKEYQARPLDAQRRKGESGGVRAEAFASRCFLVAPLGGDGGSGGTVPCVFSPQPRVPCTASSGSHRWSLALFTIKRVTGERTHPRARPPPCLQRPQGEAKPAVTGPLRSLVDTHDALYNSVSCVGQKVVHTSENFLESHNSFLVTWCCGIAGAPSTTHTAGPSRSAGSIKTSPQDSCAADSESDLRVRASHHSARAEGCVCRDKTRQHPVSHHSIPSPHPPPKKKQKKKKHSSRARTVPPRELPRPSPAAL